ncbi:DUF4302 domain-containing protein [Chitinophaga cymbidii]|uniref:DUF4302 domain-containing protein n=1 Tax=Chitinophaga cymbidii TaxID=1096750 RepID=A0A512RE94_9BACT|nr:DUF4302 domain-containing protein [Chitinophaga cymbidii]GEP94026.1 hypothetical protein CCY01nite_02860 [Chitinophaga cymbidii]
MKRTLLYILAVITTLSACRKDDDPIFDKSPDQRINETLAAYQAALAGSQYGWNGELITADSVVYHFHFSFNDANRVQMFADIDSTTAGVRKESSFRLKALQQPALLFDTYSYIHILADPDGSVNGGAYGEGLNSDFEFSLDTLTAESIRLTGRFKGSKMTLTKATQQDEQNWVNGQWKKAMQFEYFSQYILHYFKRLVIGTRNYEMTVDHTARTIRFTWIGTNGNVQQHTTNYYYTSDGLTLETPLTDGSTTINFIANIAWDAASTAFRAQVNGTSTASMRGANAPVNVDLDAPQRWWLTQASIGSYWISFNGFHVDGVDDAFGVRDLPNFYFLLFWPAYGADFDLGGYVFLENGGLSLNFGAAFRTPPVFTSNGRIIFDYLQGLGNIPPDAEDAYLNTAIKFNDPGGFYLVQTSPASYDMVSASDAKTWISWTE